MTADDLKGHLDLLLLAALRARPAHGYAIIDTIRKRSGETFDLPEGTIYPALHRLEQAGLLSSAWTTTETGRKRRVYSLTRRGASALTEQRKDWGRFARAVDALLGRGRAWPA